MLRIYRYIGLWSSCQFTYMLKKDINHIQSISVKTEPEINQDPAAPATDAATSTTNSTFTTLTTYEEQRNGPRLNAMYAAMLGAGINPELPPPTNGYHVSNAAATSSDWVKLYPCDQCHYSAKSARTLRQHQQSRHEGIRYQCDQCTYAATKASDLKVHREARHEGVVFYCDICDYSGATKRQLRKHKESKHEGVRYPCDQCSYAATAVQSLRMHIRYKHEGIRYPCDLCSYAAIQPSDLKKHKKRMHGEMGDHILLQNSIT